MHLFSLTKEVRIGERSPCIPTNSVFALSGFNTKVGFNVKIKNKTWFYHRQFLYQNYLKTFFELFLSRFYEIQPCFRCTKSELSA